MEVFMDTNMERGSVEEAYKNSGDFDNLIDYVRMIDYESAFNDICIYYQQMIDDKDLIESITLADTTILYQKLFETLDIYYDADKGRITNGKNVAWSPDYFSTLMLYAIRENMIMEVRTAIWRTFVAGDLGAVGRLVIKK